jgi:hypothetical protein
MSGAMLEGDAVSVSNDRATITFAASPLSGPQPALPLREFGNVLKIFSPQSLRLEAVLSTSRGPLALLNVDFEPPRDTNSASKANLLKRAVAKLEGELDYDASWGDGNWFASEEPWSFLAPFCRSGRLRSGKQVAVIFEPSVIAAEVFRLAALNDFDVYFGAEINRVGPDPDLVHDIVPTLAELKNDSMQPQLTAALTSVISVANAAGWSAKEYYGLPQSARQFAPLLEDVIRNAFFRAAPFLSKDFVDCDWTDVPFENETADQYSRLMSRRPEVYLHQLFERLFSTGLELGDTKLLTGQLKPNAPSQNDKLSSQQPFVFISYSHRNIDFAKDLARVLENAKIPVWIDEKIGAGSVWDESLEARIKSCAVLIACVSDDYQDSKYCRRELKFADLLGKPILPVSDKPWSWGKGLQMMFQEIQILNVRNSGWPIVISSLRDLVPMLK